MDGGARDRVPGVRYVVGDGLRTCVADRYFGRADSEVRQGLGRQLDKFQALVVHALHRHVESTPAAAA